MATRIQPEPVETTPCPRGRGKTGVRTLSKATRVQLIISLSLALLILSLVLLQPTISTFQQFSFRLILALAVSGIAVLITGFLEIELKSLRLLIRAGGPIAVFIFVYSFNPPIFEQFESMSELRGEYDYECTINEGNFLHGGVQHGGRARIELVRNKFSNALSIRGTREWTKKNKNSERVPVETPSIWQTQSSNVTADNRLLYEYSTTEKGATYLGFTMMNIDKDDEGNIILEGKFQRLAPAQDIYGTIIMKKRK